MAKQIASIGGDAQQALKSGTFPPGDVNDATAKGNTCDTADDEPGCIFTQNLLVEDATADEIDAAVAGVTAAASIPASGSGAASSAAAQTIDVSPVAASVSSSLSVVTASSSGVANASAKATSPTSGCDSASPSTAATTPTSLTSKNIQTFTGTFGGAPPPVTSAASDRPFSVNGATFVNACAAIQRSCAIQHNSCANAANSGALSGGVGQCDTQENACNSASSSKKNKRALDLGSCTDPTIKFANGLDGRKEPAFAPVNTAEFNHGSALNIGVISAFVCQQLTDKCKAGADATAACAKGETDAAKETGQAAADAFNAALGGGASATSVAANAGNSTCGTTGSVASTAAPAASSVSTTANNIQSFTGAVGGLPPAVVQSSGSRPFSVNGDTFVNKAAALQRSCSVQHNACADAANGGQIAGGVAQCETQEGACNAAAAGQK